MQPLIDRNWNVYGLALQLRGAQCGFGYLVMLHAAEHAIQYAALAKSIQAARKAIQPKATRRAWSTRV